MPPGLLNLLPLGSRGGGLAERLGAVAENLLVELADRRLGHLVDEADLVRQPPLGDLPVEELADLLRGDLALEVGSLDDEGDRPLVPTRVGESDDGRFKASALKVLAKSFVELNTLPAEPDMSKLYTEAFLPAK